MRGIGPRKPLPVVVPARAETTDKAIDCATCDAGYRAVAGELVHLSGNVYWKRRRAAEEQHGHFLFSGYPADKPLRWEEHCVHCHEAGGPP